MTRPPRLKLEWSELLGATGPDGTEYQIQREAPIHEGVWYTALAWRPGAPRGPWEASTPRDFPDELEVFPNGFGGTKAQAIRWCEVDAARQAEKDGER